MCPIQTKTEVENKRDTQYNGIYVRFHYIEGNGGFIKIRKKTRKAEICPICLKALEESDNLYLVMSNQAGIPNRVLHEDCVTSPQETINKLADLYKEAKIMHKQFWHWF